MKFSKTLIFFSLISVIGLMASLSPNTAQAFPFSPGNPNNGSSACYHNGDFYGMVFGGVSCSLSLPPEELDKHLQPGETVIMYPAKHTIEDCVILETPFND